MNKPFLIIIDGPMGSGKSTVAQLLQKKIKEKTALISLDNLKRIVSSYKLDSHVHLSLASKAGAAMANVYLKEGVNVLVEKAFIREKFLKSFVNSIKVKSRVFIYQIEVPFHIGFSRVKEREKLKEKGIPKNKLKEKVTRNYSHYHQFRYRRARVFDSSELSPGKIVNKILKDIK
jgi:predicted ABC-type ATPase